MKLPVIIDPRYHDAVVFDAQLVAHPPQVDSAIMLVHLLHRIGIESGVYSLDGPCNEALRSGDVEQHFPMRVDSTGQPDTAVLAAAAHQLAARPDRSVVVANSERGVVAARDAGFGMVVIAVPAGHVTELRRSGADAVINALAEVTVRTENRRMSKLPDALTSYPQLATVLAFRRPVLLFDFDGTLSAIVDDPSSATLVPGMADVLAALATLCPVAVLSGRDLADIRKRVGLDGVWYAGSHGFELVGPDGVHHQNESATPAIHALEKAAAELREQFAGIHGIMVEHKRFAVAVHYRNAAAERIGAVLAAVRSVGQRDGFRVTGGRKVIELRPDINWDKGTALQWLLDRLPRDRSPVMPIYIGDDLTDEDAFDVVRHDGIGIVVAHSEDGNRTSAAQFRLENPDGVRVLTEKLVADIRAASTSDPWSIVFEGYQPGTELLREALCTVGNGYFATRGCAPESCASESHYPGTYVAGIYNRLSDRILGQTVENESMVNLPNWLPLTFRIDDGPWFDVDSVEVLSYRQELDLRRALLTRRFRFRDAAGHTVTVTQRRLAAMHMPHIAALETTVLAENWSGKVQFRSLVDAGVENRLVGRYRGLSGKHLTVLKAHALSEDSVLVAVETSQSRIFLALAVRTSVWNDFERCSADYQFVHQEGRRAGHDITVTVQAGQSITVDKVATIYTGRDRAISEPAIQAARSLQHSGRYRDLAQEHELAWTHLWERFTINIAGGPDELRVVRLYLLHLLQTLSPYTADLDVGVPARGLHGEAYRGHIFWDELFVLPVLNLREPVLTRSLLDYRYRRLPEARRAARDAGRHGAMFPWQSGSSGREESQRLHLNPRSGHWNPDPSARAHHSGLAIAYNVWQYYQATADLEYLTTFGAELLVEIAQFWMSLARFDTQHDRYVIRGVIGPDEFHTGYPGRLYDGIDNNAYTNVMAVWVILRAMDVLTLLPLRDRLRMLETTGLSTGDLADWEKVSRRMFVPFHKDGVISQFEGYEGLAELDWESYRSRYGNIQRLDRILEAENDNVNHYKASKQADVLMLFYLLSADELRALLGRLGYGFAPVQIPRTVDYYLKRTSHGSTLSAVVHSWVLARGSRDRAMEYFQTVLKSDIADIQHGTTAEGIHLAAMGGSVDLLQRCFTGLEMRDGRLFLCPEWPEELGELNFPLQYRGHRLYLEVRGRAARVSAEPGNAAPIDVMCRGRVHCLMPGSTVEVS